MYDYLYNEKTHVMHISGLCPHAQPRSLKHYQSEDAAAQDGARFLMCKTCSQKRDKLMQEMNLCEKTKTNEKEKNTEMKKQFKENWKMYLGLVLVGIGLCVLVFLVFDDATFFATALFMLGFTLVIYPIYDLVQAKKSDNRQNHYSSLSTEKLLEEYERKVDYIEFAKNPSSVRGGAGMAALGSDIVKHDMEKCQKQGKDIAAVLKKRGVHVDVRRLEGTAGRVGAGKASVVGRTVVGGVVGGEVGAVIGAASAINKNNQSKK